MPLKTITNFLKQTNELKVAETLLDTFSKYSANNFQFDELAQLYYEIKSYYKSAQFAEKSLAVSKNLDEMYAARQNLAKVYNHMNEPFKALNNINLNLSINPYDYETKMEEIFSYYLLGEYVECENKLKNMLEDTDLPENIRDRVNFNLATYEMERGNFKSGFRSFTLDGKKVDVFRKIPPLVQGMTEWDGVSTDKKLLVLHRGGIGDELINIRFMKKLDMDLEPVWFTSFKDLKPVFNRNGYKTISHISELVNPEEYVFCSSMDLPCILNLDKEELGREPYIVPDPVYVEKHKNKKGVGIKWAGNKDYEHDLHRSLPLKELMNVVSGCGKEIYSLQKEDNEELDNFPFVTDLASELNTIEDTLGIIWNLDYVVTSCTSIAHMCASMGKKVFVLPPISCYYVWLGRNDERSDWYNDNCVVLRQTTWKSWQKPLERLRGYIDELQSKPN